MGSLERGVGIDRVDVVPILEEKYVWGTDAATQISYMDTQIFTRDIVFLVPMNETYQLLGVDLKDIITSENYLQDYFTNILKKMKDLEVQSKQS